jgi:hypothetical protein
VSNRPSQQLLGTDFSTELSSQKQSTDELCEVLNLVNESAAKSFRSQVAIQLPSAPLTAVVVQ